MNESEIYACRWSEFESQTHKKLRARVHVQESRVSAMRIHATWVKTASRRWRERGKKWKMRKLKWAEWIYFFIFYLIPPQPWQVESDRATNVAFLRAVVNDGECARLWSFVEFSVPCHICAALALQTTRGILLTFLSLNSTRLKEWLGTNKIFLVHFSPPHQTRFTRRRRRERETVSRRLNIKSRSDCFEFQQMNKEFV